MTVVKMELASLDPELLHILQHSLGLDQYGQGHQYRNHYCAGMDELEKCRRLVEMGYMRERQASNLTGGDLWYQVTRDGIDAVSIYSPKPPKISRGRERYLRWLQSGTTETFGEWLKKRRWEAINV